MNSEFYQQRILHHYHNPRNYGLLGEFNAEARNVNMVCGDAMSVRLAIDRGAVRRVGFESDGCVMSRAAASLMSEHILGKTADEIRAMGSPDVVAALGVEPTGTRLKCAMLFLETVQRAL